MGKTDYLGEFEQLVLLAVLRLGPDAYGAAVQRELEEQGSRQASVSSIYITLTRMEEKGLVASRMGSPTDDRGGKARRYFQATQDGVQALSESRTRLLEMWEGMESILEKGRS